MHLLIKIAIVISAAIAAIIVTLYSVHFLRIGAERFGPSTRQIFEALEVAVGPLMGAAVTLTVGAVIKRLPKGKLWTQPMRMTLWQGWEFLHSWRFSSKPRRINKVFSGIRWRETLHHLYPDYPLVEFGGSEFPIWAKHAHPRERENLDSIEGVLNAKVPDLNRFYREGLSFDEAGAREFKHHLRRQDGHRRINGLSYVLDGIDLSQPEVPKINAKLDGYFQSLATSEMLEREFMKASARHSNRSLTLADLPRRSWLHERVKDVILDGSYRAAALSVAATIIIRNPRHGYSVLLEERSRKVKTHPGLRHVVPSGILQPTSLRNSSIRAEFSIQRSFLREYAEELFCYDELAVDDGTPSDKLRNLWPVDELRSAQADGKVLIRYCGISVPLMTLRPEVYILMFVQDPEWFDDMVKRSEDDDAHRFRLNWEFVDEHEPLKDRQVKSIRLDLDDDFQLLDDEKLWSPTNTVPHAAAALWLSTQVARDLVNGDATYRR